MSDTEETTEEITPTAEELAADELIDNAKAEDYGTARKKTFRRLKSLTKLNKYIVESKKIFVSAVKIAVKPHPVVVINEVLNHANSYINKQAAGYVVGNKGWKYILGLPDAFGGFLFKKLAAKGVVETMTTSGKVRVTVKLVSVGGVDFRYLPRDRELMYANGPSIEEVMAVLGRVIIEDVGPRFKYTRQIELTGRRGNGVHKVLPLIPEKIYPSKMGDALINRLQPFLKKGVNRSIFLVGAPGTGKTCMTEYISEKIGGTCLTFEAAELFTMNITQMKFILNLLKPDTLIVNDIDRAMGTTTSNVLGILETISKYSTLTVVTANNAKLTPAALRPGRFDEVIPVATLGDDTVKAMLKDFPKEVYAQVEGWPAAFVNELVVRANVLGKVNIAMEIAELQLRVDYNGTTDKA